MATNQIPRHYTCKDVEVLTASAEIISIAQANLAEIVAKRPLWKDPFFPNLKKRVDTAFKTFLGVDNAATLRGKTDALKLIMMPAQDDLSTFKINIETDFKKKKPRLAEIETVLGYTALWKQVTRNDEEACIELLYTYNENMTPELRTEITAAGTSDDLITTITAYADALNAANITQEFAKSQRPLGTAAGINEFNAIYDAVIGVCKICRNIYIANPVMRNNFSFAATVRRLNVQPKKKAPAK